VKLTLVLPMHDEEGNVPELWRRVRDTLDGRARRLPGFTWEVIAADDVSGDRTPALLAALAKEDPRLRPVRHPERRGQTGGFDTGFRNATGHVVLTMDADLQNQPEDIDLLLDAMRDRDLELVNAVRRKRRHGILIRLSSRIYNLLMKLFFLCPVSDAASNFTAIDARFVRDLPLLWNDHRYLIPILQRRGLRRVGEVETRHEERKAGRAKYGVSKALGGFPELLRAWWRLHRGFYDGKPAGDPRGGPIPWEPVPPL